MPFINEARKKSPDPLQERLRANKEAWNKACSVFIAELIAFKKGLNGRGDPKYSLPPSNIKDPLPSQVLSLLNRISGDYEHIISGANSIIKEQENYSKTRRKKVEKKAELEVEASNPLTRLVSRIKSIVSSDKYKGYRMAMLNTSINLYKNLRIFQDEVLDRKIEDLPVIMDAFLKNLYTFSLIEDYLNRLKEVMQKEEHGDDVPIVDNTGNISKELHRPMLREDIETPKKEKESPHEKEKKEFVHWDVLNLRELKKDLQEIIDVGLPISMILPVTSKLMEYERTSDEDKKELLKDLIYDEYDKVIIEARKIIKEKTGLDLSEDATLAEIADRYEQFMLKQKEKKAFVINAGNPLSRWMKKKLYRMAPFDNTAAARLEIIELTEQIMKELDKLMNILEERVDVDELAPVVAEIDGLFNEMKKSIQILSTVNKEHYLSVDRDKKDHPSRRDLLELELRRKIKRDIDKELL